MSFNKNLEQSQSALRNIVCALNDIKDDRGCEFKGIKLAAKQIEEAIKDGQGEVEVTLNNKKCTVNIRKAEQKDQTWPSTEQWKVSFSIFGDCNDQKLELLKEFPLWVYEKKKGAETKYKFGAEFVCGEEKYVIGGLNKNLPRKSQVSSGPVILKKSGLVAKATGSGKTIEKIMAAVEARISGKKVVSVVPRSDLVDQEYKNEIRGVLAGKSDIVGDNKYYADKSYNILDLNEFYKNFNKIIDFEKFSELTKKYNIEGEAFEVDLEKNRILLGEKKNIEIYKDHYIVNGKKHQGSIFQDQELLVMLDEIQDMTNEAAHLQVVKLLLLLGEGWKKISLGVYTATPTKLAESYFNGSKGKDKGYIATQSLQGKINDSIGGKIDLKINESVSEGNFAKKYVDHLRKYVHVKSTEDSFYYDPDQDETPGIEIKDKIKKYLMWNLQTPLNRMTLACIDSEKHKQKLVEQLRSPIEQLNEPNTQDQRDNMKVDESKIRYGFLQGQNDTSLHDKFEDALLEKFGSEHAAKIREVFEEFDTKANVAQIFTNAVVHGVFDLVIAYVLETEPHKLERKRFADFNKLKTKFKGKFPNIQVAEQEIFNKCTEKFGIRNSRDLRLAINEAWKVFQKYKDNEKMLDVLLMNHNLSREIHSMILPPLEELGNDRIIEIFEQEHHVSLFNYLKDNYEKDGYVAKVETKCNKLYHGEYKRKKKEREEKEKHPDVVKYKKLQHDTRHDFADYCRAMRSIKESDGYKEYNKALGEYYEVCCRLIQEFKSIQNGQLYSLTELGRACSKLAIIKQNKEKENYEGEEGYGPSLAQTGAVGLFFRDAPSGYSNKSLHNFVQVQTRIGDLKDVQQGVGRVGRVNGPIVSYSTVFSCNPKACNPEEMKKEIMEGGLLDSCKDKESVIDRKEMARSVSENIKNIINQEFNGVEKVVERVVIEVVLKTHNEIYNRIGHNPKKTNNIFSRVLTEVISNLNYELERKGVVTGDGKIKINMHSIASEIDKITHEIQQFYLEKNPELKEKRIEEINKKLDVNIIKRLIFWLCELVVRLFNWRISCDESKVNEILQKDSSPSIKERIILKGVRSDTQKEVKSIKEEKQKMEDKKNTLPHELTKLENEYHKQHKCIGVIEKKDGVKQKELATLSEEKVKSIIEGEIRGIEYELTEVSCALKKVKEHDKSLEKLKDLKEEIKGIKLAMEGPQGRNGIKEEGLKDKLLKKIEDQRSDNSQNNGTLSSINRHEGTVHIERLYLLTEEALRLYSGDNQSDDVAKVKKLLSRYDELMKEKERLDKIQQEKEVLERMQLDLTREKEDLKNNKQDHDKARNIESRTAVYNSINGSYNSEVAIWLQLTYIKFYKSFCEIEKDPIKSNEYMRSSIFKELFTNTFFPLMNKGDLRTAFDVSEMAECNIDSENKVGKVNDFYRNLQGKNFDEARKGFDGMLKYMGDVIFQIFTAKLSYHIDAIGRDNNLISKLSFGKFDIYNLLKEHFGHSVRNAVRNSDQEYLKKFFDVLQNYSSGNELAQGIRKLFSITSFYNTGRINNGIPMASSSHLLWQAGKLMLAKRRAENIGGQQSTVADSFSSWFSNPAILKAKHEIAELEGKRNVQKEVHECLKALMNVFQGRDSNIKYSEELIDKQKAMKFSETIGKVLSTASYKPVSSTFLTDPKPECHYPVQRELHGVYVQSVAEQMQNNLTH